MLVKGAELPQERRTLVALTDREIFLITRGLYRDDTRREGDLNDENNDLYGEFSDLSRELGIKNAY